MSAHYTAVVEIHKTTTVGEQRDRYDKVTTPGARDVVEVARIVVRADSLAALTVKATAHLELIE